MQENLVWTDDDSWIAEAITDNLCIAVTSGSFMANLYPQVNATALVLGALRAEGGYGVHFQNRW
jgi:hypothetical protein